MASIEECRAIVDDLAAKLHAVDDEARKKQIPERSIELQLLDLDISFVGQLHDGELIDIHQTHPGKKHNVRLVMTSDDLVALNRGELKFAHAWATGRVRLDASIRDLLRLRSMM